MRGYLLNVAVGLDVFAASVIGCPRYMTISGTIGKSIRAGGWARKVPWPAWFSDHCLESDFSTEV